MSAGPGLSLFDAMRAGAYTQNGLRAMLNDRHRTLSHHRVAAPGHPWMVRARSAWTDAIGSVEAGKEADLIAVDPSLTLPVPGLEADAAEDLASRLIFRAHPAMVRAAWVRGRRLDGPGS